MNDLKFIRIFHTKSNGENIMCKKASVCFHCGSKAVMYYEDCALMELQFCSSCQRQSAPDSFSEFHRFFSSLPRMDVDDFRKYEKIKSLSEKYKELALFAEYIENSGFDPLYGRMGVIFRIAAGGHQPYAEEYEVYPNFNGRTFTMICTYDSKRFELRDMRLTNSKNFEHHVQDVYSNGILVSSTDCPF